VIGWDGTSFIEWGGTSTVERDEAPSSALTEFDAIVSGDSSGGVNDACSAAVFAVLGAGGMAGRGVTRCGGSAYTLSMIYFDVALLNCGAYGVCAGRLGVSTAGPGPVLAGEPAAGASMVPTGTTSVGLVSTMLSAGRASTLSAMRVSAGAACKATSTAGAVSLISMSVVARSDGGGATVNFPIPDSSTRPTLMWRYG
jgi:hypothetical protein